MKVKHYGATYTYCRLARGGVGFTDADGKPVRVTPEEARYWLQHRCQYCKGLIWFGSSTIHEACAMPLARKLLHVIDLNGTPTVEPEGRNSNERGLR